MLFAFEGWGDAERLIQYPDALDAFTSSPLVGTGQTVAIIDSGIDYTHPSLGGGYGPGFKIVGGHDFVDDDNDPIDTYGHGTEIAGIIAADPYVADGLDHSGIAPGAKLVALRIDGNGVTSVPDSRIEAALKWCIDHRIEFGITVINISYGTGHFDEPTVSSIYGDEIQTLTDFGVSIVAASGNEGISGGLGIDTPAADPNVISVGSVDSTDRISDFTERGYALSLLAPGELISTTLRLGGFGNVDGTSFAAPFVAGTIALMKSHDPTLKPADVQSILQASGTPVFDGDDEALPASRLTFQRLNVLGAMQLTDARLPADQPEQAKFGYAGNGNSLAVDRFGITHFVYYDSIDQTMKYASLSNSGVWSRTQLIDTSMPFQGSYLSIAVDTWGRPSIAYFDGNNGDLRYSHFNGIRWSAVTLDVKNSTGLYPSLAFDRNQLPVIAYYRKTSGDLRVARLNGSGNWEITAVDTNGDVGRDASITVDASGRVGIAYADSTHGWLKYALYSPKTKLWNSIVIDNLAKGVAFVSATIDQDNNPVVSYYDAGPSDLKVARFSNRKWKTSHVATRGGTGLYSSVHVRDNNELEIIFYNKSQNNLQLAASDGNAWQFNILKNAAGRFSTSVFDDFDGVYRFSYFDPATKKITVAQLER